MDEARLFNRLAKINEALDTLVKQGEEVGEEVLSLAKEIEDLKGRVQRLEIGGPQ